MTTTNRNKLNALYARWEPGAPPALPSSLAPPDIVPEPDGEIAVDRDFGPSLQLSISVGPSGPLHFAGVIGEDYGQPRVSHGTEPFESVVADDLLGYIHALHERAGVSNSND
jgi:hypothetical protein